MDTMDAPAGGAPMAKARLRRRLVAAREGLGSDGRGAQALAIADALVRWAPLADLQAGSTAAAYVGAGSEPSTSALLATLEGRGLRVLLPLWRHGTAELDWALYTGADDLANARAGLLEPQGDALGPDAIASATVILLPALAVDRAGNRLGRGAGAYDAALRRAAPDATTCALLYTGELLDELPVEPHDRRVSAAALPDGVHDLGR
jgi:5-formyltetrahydrofolate cyclo-ligase